MEEGKSSDDAPTYSVQLFVKEALQVKITPMMLDQYTSEWTEMCRQQNAQSAEVEHLRAINKKLSQQVRHLEGSLAQINQEHCELVKQVVATRLEKEELEDELVRVKMALAQESLVRTRDSHHSSVCWLIVLPTISCVKRDEALLLQGVPMLHILAPGPCRRMKSDEIPSFRYRNHESSA